MRKYDPMCGTFIGDACEIAAQMANDGDGPVQFEFNGITMTAEPGDSTDRLVDRWNEASEARRIAHEQTPEHAQHLREREFEISHRQATVDRLVDPENFPQSESAWLAWAADLSEHADDTGVTFNKTLLAERLCQQGWKPNDCVSNDPEFRNRLESERPLMARYIMGQVIDNLLNGMSPHPMTGEFVRRYRAV